MSPYSPEGINYARNLPKNLLRTQSSLNGSSQMTERHLPGLSNLNSAKWSVEQKGSGGVPSVTWQISWMRSDNDLTRPQNKVYTLKLWQWTIGMPDGGSQTLLVACFSVICIPYH